MFDLTAAGAHTFYIARGVGSYTTAVWNGVSKGKLAEHYEKVVVTYRELGDITQTQYLTLAKGVAGETGDFLERQVGPVVVKYDVITRRTLIVDVGDREIRTFYIADLGLDAKPCEAAVARAEAM